MKILKNLLIAGIVIAVFVWMGFTLSGNKARIDEQNKVVDRSAIAIPVSVAAAKTGPVENRFTLPALVESQEEAVVSANTSGKLTSLQIELGSVVTRGQEIGSVDNSLRELNLASTRLLITKYEQDHARVKDLFAGNAATEVEVINARYNLDNARLQAAQIEQQIRDARILAPISGVVVKKDAVAGEFVNTGAPIATIVDHARMKATVMVSEREVYKLRPGMTVPVRCDIYPDVALSSKIRYISPQGDQNHNYAVELTLQNSGRTPLKAGTFIRAEFDLRSGGEVLQVPKTALVEGAKNPFVFLVKGNRAEMRRLVLGRETGNSVEVIDGLKEGEQVITGGQINLADGSLIEIVNQ